MSFGGDGSNTPYEYDDRVNTWETDPNAGGIGFNNNDSTQPLTESETIAAATRGATHINQRGQTQDEHDVDVTTWVPNKQEVVAVGKPVVTTATKDSDGWFSWRSYSLGFVSGSVVVGVLSYFLK